SGIYHLLVVQFIRTDHRVQTKASGSTCLRPAISFHNLVITKSELGFERPANQITAALLFARVISKRDQIRKVFHFIYQTEIVEIENATGISRCLEFCA